MIVHQLRCHAKAFYYRKYATEVYAQHAHTRTHQLGNEGHVEALVAAEDVRRPDERAHTKVHCSFNRALSEALGVGAVLCCCNGALCIVCQMLQQRSKCLPILQIPAQSSLRMRAHEVIDLSAIGC